MLTGEGEKRALRPPVDGRCGGRSGRTEVV